MDNLDLFAQFSAAAYCSANLNATGTALACDVGNCPAVEAADTTILYSFDKLASLFGNIQTYNANEELMILVQAALVMRQVMSQSINHMDISSCLSEGAVA